MSSIAYALRAEHHDTYLGGVVAVGDDSLDIRQALQDGDGVIVVAEHDTQTLTVLDAYPPLERVAMPADGDPARPVGYVPAAPPAPAAETVAQLREHARELGIENPGRSREEITAAITAHVTAPPTGDDEQGPGADAPGDTDSTTEG